MKKETSSAWVEFVGLPGSGKSTLAAAVLERVSGSEVEVWSRREIDRKLRSDCEKARLRVLTKRLTQATGLMLTSAPAAWAHVDAGDRLRNLYAIGMYRELLRECDRNPGFRLLDQGILQAMSVVFAGMRERRVTALLGHLPATAMAGVVSVDLPNEIAIARIKTRTTGVAWFDKLPEEKLRLVLGSWRASIATVIKAIEAVGVPVLRVDGADAVDTSSHVVAAWLPQWTPTKQ